MSGKVDALSSFKPVRGFFLLQALFVILTFMKIFRSCPYLNNARKE